jgi:arylsulfatase B
MPTLSALCNLRSVEHLPWDGKDISPLILSDDPDWPERTIITDSQRIEDPEKWRRSSVMTDRWRLINGRELYDITADPGQETDVAEAHPDIVEKLRQDYEKWWQSVSVDFDKYTRTILGSDKENPVMLSSHDWHTQASQRAWHQVHVQRGGPKKYGYWMVEVARSGDYEIALRRWPRGCEEPLRDRFIDVTQATLQIGEQKESTALAPGTNEATFTLKLKKGKAKFTATFEDDRGEKRGVFFAYVKRV